jgi:hypothetical protein
MEWILEHMIAFPPRHTLKVKLDQPKAASHLRDEHPGCLVTDFDYAGDVHDKSPVPPKTRSGACAC